MGETLRINCFNVNGLNGENKRNSIFQWIRANHNGISFLQETHSSSTSEDKWVREWGNEIKFCHGVSNSRGVAILLSNNLDIDILETIKDNTGRLILIHCKIFDMDFSLINVYCPTKDDQELQLKFLEFINETLEKYCEENIIIAGDFNTYLNINLDKKGGANEKPSKYVNGLLSLLENFNLVDIWRIRNPQKKRYTRRENCRNGIVHSRLDYFFVSRQLEYIIFNVDIKPSIKSDHSFLTIDIKFSEIQKRGKGLWKMNVKYLSDSDFVERIKNCIQKAKEDSVNICDKHKVWDFIKCSIRTESIRFSVEAAQKQKKEEKYLIERITYLEEKIDSSCNVELIENLSLLKAELDFIYNEKAKGIIIRSRCKWFEENEKSTKFFLTLEKNNYNTKHIKSLIINDKLVNNQNEILRCEKSFYQNLYSEKSNFELNQLNRYLKNIDSPKITNETRKMCDNDITEEEYFLALKDLPNKKSPGSDGIPVEFYKTFWSEIKDTLLDSFKLSKEKKFLSRDQREGIINLIPKEGKDLRNLKNWRPISLLNADYKILSKALANKLKTALSEIINPDQIGYMKGRFCGENTRLIADMIEYSQLYKEPGIILLIDFEKAFDTVNWKFLFKILEFYNFGPNFIDWIQIIYNKISSCVTNNGHSSTPISIERGIRQGDPISALLFLPIVEILATSVRNDEDILGFNIQGKELKLCQLADDITIFVKTNASVRRVLNIFEEFYRYAGLRINNSKTIAIIIWNDGSIIQDNKLKIQWNKQTF